MIMKKTLPCFVLAALLAASFPASVGAAKKARVLTFAEKKIVGSYRCRSYNVSGGGGGNCRLAPPIVLKADGTYSMSSERGTFSVKKGRLILSKSTLRGPGSITANPATITFRYMYKGWKHIVTYGREATARNLISSEQGVLSQNDDTQEKRVSAAKEESQNKQPVPETVPLELTIIFPESDSTPWVNVISLVPQGYTPASAPYRPESLALQEGRSSTFYASYYGVKEVMTGKVYDVYASSGFESQKVGSVDLTSPMGLVKAVLTVLPVAQSQSAPADTPPVSAPDVSSSQPAASSSASTAPCNPSLPHYAGGC